MLFLLSIYLLILSYINIIFNTRRNAIQQKKKSRKYNKKELVSPTHFHSISTKPNN